VFGGLAGDAEADVLFGDVVFFEDGLRFFLGEVGWVDAQDFGCSHPRVGGAGHYSPTSQVHILAIRVFLTGVVGVDRHRSSILVLGLGVGGAFCTFGA